MKTRFLLATIFTIVLVSSTGRQIISAQESISAPEFTLEESIWEYMDVENVEEFLKEFAKYPEHLRPKDLVGTVVADFVVTT
jgi:hypothetical protein